MPFSKHFQLQYIRTKFRILSSLSGRKAAKSAFTLFCTPQYRHKKELTPIFKKAQLLRFDFYHYHIQGFLWNAESDKRILIVHGFESSILNFEQYITPLTEKGYCVLGFDAPAHGRSSGKTINVLIYKEFIQTIIQRYGPVKNFLAHSLGGLALSLALEEIEHDASCKVVLIAPATETTTSINIFFKHLGLTEAVRREFDALIRKMSGQEPGWFSIRRAAEGIGAKVLWFHDKNDHMTPLKDAMKIKKAGHPNFEFIVTERLGHRRIYRDSNVMKQIFRFL